MSELKRFKEQHKYQLENKCIVAVEIDELQALITYVENLEKERREMACAAMETCDMIHDGDYQEAYNYLEENFKSIYNET